MKRVHSAQRLVVLLSLLWLPVLQAFADDYADTVDLFRNALEDRTFIDEAYGYAVFPTVGKGGWFVGGAYGEGRVFARGDYIGDVVMKQLTLGLQLGGQAYSQIVVFQDERALREFIGGNFEFGAQATAVAVTAGAQAAATTTGSSAGASGGKHDATTVGAYYKGMALFTIVKGGLMYEVSLGGQRFEYKPRKVPAVQTQTYPLDTGYSDDGRR